MRAFCSALLGLLIVHGISSSWAHAQASAAEPLRWTHDSPCAPPADSTSGLAQLSGERGRWQGQEPFVASVWRSEQGYVLELRGPAALGSPTRTLELASCDEARETALLLIAMALDPATSAPPEAPPPAPAPPRAPAPPLQAGLSAGLALDALSLPRVAPGLALGGLLQRRRWRVALLARYVTAAQTETLPADARARANLFALAPRGCGLWSLRAWQLGACAELELGSLAVRPQGLAEQVAQRSFWLSPAAVGSLAYQMAPRWSLEFTFHLGASLRRPRFAVYEQAPFYEVPGVSLRSTLQVVFLLGPTELAGAGHVQ